MIENLSPLQAWETLASDSTSVLVDVRTRAEWGFVGAPDLSSLGKSVVLVEWMSFPSMQINSNFAQQLLAQLQGTPPSVICFLCRSGQRSQAAGMLMQDHFDQQSMQVECINVAEGFEGDLDSNGHRGGMNGWKARGLAWRQT